jgi:hypothetical protein
VLLAANIALLHQNRQLKLQLSLPPPTLEAAPGVQVPDLHGLDLSGKPLEVLYGKDPRKVLVFVFSPTCAFCDENWPRWQEIMPALDPEAVRPVAVDITSTSNPLFLAKHQLAGVPVLVQVDPRATLSYRFHLTPQTILVDRTGRVEKVWTGVLNDSALAELKRLLGENRAASQRPADPRPF